MMVRWERYGGKKSIERENDQKLLLELSTILDKDKTLSHLPEIYTSTLTAMTQGLLFRAKQYIF